MTDAAGGESSAVERLTKGIGSEEDQQILARCLTGTTSPPVALMQLLIETEDAAKVRAIVDEVTMRAASVSRSTDSLLRDRVDELTQLVVENEPGCEMIAGMLRDTMDSPKPAPSVEEGIAFCERLFDWSVRQSEEASVALYSLGNAEILERATREIVAQLELWNLLSQHRTVLDFGCGIGRVAAELSSRVMEVQGIDVSSGMVEAARRRCSGLPNVHFTKGTGRDLREYADESLDVAIAVDTFPYLVRSGSELVSAHFAEMRRVLRPRGDLVILNYSYRGDEQADVTDVRRLAGDYGFDVIVAGERPFTVWDGLAFHLRLRGSEESEGAFSGTQ